jgi:hypothetical protein
MVTKRFIKNNPDWLETNARNNGLSLREAAIQAGLITRDQNMMYKGRKI